MMKCRAGEQKLGGSGEQDWEAHVIKQGSRGCTGKIRADYSVKAGPCMALMSRLGERMQASSVGFGSEGGPPLSSMCRALSAKSPCRLAQAAAVAWHWVSGSLCTASAVQAWTHCRAATSCPSCMSPAGAAVMAPARREGGRARRTCTQLPVCCGKLSPQLSACARQTGAGCADAQPDHTDAR